MENPKASAIERLRDANNVLVTVSNNPSVDQLAGAIGMTLLLNKLGKHATAVFSGKVPPTIEFLKPEETLERTTDSLRDFIIALDKAKADKLRYKVEDKLVKIFITPYRTSLSQDDLEFSQGDFNVDVVLALGVHEQKDLDEAIRAHGRILHDATIVSLNTKDVGHLGNIEWVEPKASSLCEMLVTLGESLKKEALDTQIATALLTGIVAETKRFSNEKTSPETMSISSRLMTAGANQQLVATKLQEQLQPSRESKPDQTVQPIQDAADDGSLSIDHKSEDDKPQEAHQEIHIDDEGKLKPKEGKPLIQPEHQARLEPKEKEDASSKFIMDPPSLGGTLTASGKPENLDPSTDPLSLPPVDSPLLSHDSPAATPSSADHGNHVKQATHHEMVKKKEEKPPKEPAEPKIIDRPHPKPAPESPKPEKPSVPSPPPPPAPLPAEKKAEEGEDKTLDQIEKSVDSPHAKEPTPPPKEVEPKTEPPAQTDSGLQDLEAARRAVEAAAEASGSGPVPQANAAFGATGDLTVAHDAQPASAAQPADSKPHEYLDVTKLDASSGLQLPSNDQMPSDPTAPKVEDATAPPEVPPPFTPPPWSPPGMTHGQQPLPNAENDNDAQDPLAPL